MEMNQVKDQFNDDIELVKAIKAQRGEVTQEPTLETTPTTETTPIPETVPALIPEPVQINDELFNKYLSDKTGGKYSKLEDIQVADIPDEARQIYDLLKENKTDELYDYLRKSKEDYSKWSTEDLLRHKLKSEYPNLSESDVEEIITHDYKLGYELTEEDRDNLTPAQIKQWEMDKKMAQAKAMRDAEAIRNSLESSKKEIVLPKIDKLETVVDPNQPTPEQIEVAQKQWEAEVDAELPKFKDFNFDFKVGEDGDVLSTTFKLEGDQEKAVAQALKTTYEPGDEKLTMAQLAEKTTFKLFGRQILNAAVKDAVAKAKEKFVERELKQIDLTPGAGAGNRGGEKNIYQHLLDQ